MKKIIYFFALIFFLEIINCSYTGQCDDTSATCTIQLETKTLLPQQVSFDNIDDYCPTSGTFPTKQFAFGCSASRLTDQSASLVSYYDNTDERCDGDAEYTDADFCTGTHFMKTFAFELPTMLIESSEVYPDDDDIKKQTQSVTLTGAVFYVNHGDWERKSAGYWDTDLGWALVYYDSVNNEEQINDFAFRNWETYDEAKDNANDWANGEDRVLEYDTLESLIGNSGDPDLWHSELLNHNGFGIKGNAWYEGKGDTYSGTEIIEKLAYRLKYIKMKLKYEISLTAVGISPETGYNNTDLTINFNDYTVVQEGLIGQTSTDEIDYKVKFVKNDDASDFFIFDAEVVDHKSIQCKITEDRKGQTFDVYVKFLESADWLKVPVAFTYEDQCPQVEGVDCNGKGNCPDGTVTCECNDGWIGDDCSVEACVGVTCENGKQCSSEDGECQCGSFFTGDLCEYDICEENFDNCNSEEGHGTCISSDGHISCDCETGWGGTKCDVDYCDNNDCSGHGDCIDGVCECNLPYYGANCQSDECNGTFQGCSGNGVVNAQCVCNCDTGYSGSMCENNWCDDVTCSGKGSCNRDTGACSCDAGWEGETCNTKSESTDGLSSTVVGIISGGALIAAIGIALLVLFLIRRHQQKDKWAEILDLPVFGIDTMFGKDLDFDEDSLKSVRNKLKKRQYWDLEELLLDQLPLVQAIFEDSETKSAAALPRSILYIFEANGDAIKLLKYFVKLEVESCTDSDLLFRGTNMASKLWSGYCHLAFGVKYIHETLSHPMYEMLHKQSGKSLNLKDKEDVELEGKSSFDPSVNKYKLMATAQKIFEAIKESSPDTPLQFRIILSYVRSLVEDRFPELVHQSLGGLMILRYFTPAIAACDQFGVLDEEYLSDDTVRMLVLVAKVLQNLANGALFGVKEEYMISLNDFIESNMDVMSQYLDSVSTLYDNEDEEMVTPSPLPKDVHELSIAIVHEYLANNRSDIINKLETVVTDSRKKNDIATKLEEALDGLGEPIHITDED
ncbi:ras gtpase-activating protein [Anaeramoeba flamelloides]|uniref:Ras gtpase-activating protein n=1 Tax=Anaeramoeba flamelloides TaxID=1746091 RepID=A0AAV7YV98_9EUKA|nr:ras gtpase-activating protein [Anaeramoeba flamelloides]|eukprot:Anaeramoba_flamelloidesa566813_1937.p1 GENE.a566813_1937~~a566813_1937.p1  ORF type:complete len:1015 (-),score=197.86 a566813_1937:156-3200(-)